MRPEVDLDQARAADFDHCRESSSTSHSELCSLNEGESRVQLDTPLDRLGVSVVDYCGLMAVRVPNTCEWVTNCQIL